MSSKKRGIRREPSAPVAIVKPHEPPRQMIDGRHGFCPRCRDRHDGFVRVGRDVWFVCDRHRLRFFTADVGDLTTGERAGAARDIASYEETEPVWPAEFHPAWRDTPSRWSRDAR
jgi:hypothetical protein